jgi:hypothetical protein
VAHPISVEIGVDPSRAIFPIVKHVASALLNVAPERRDELIDASERLVIRLTDEGLWRFRFHEGDRSIEVSRKAIEFLWASALAYFVLYDEFYVTGHRGDVTQFPRVRAALDLLKVVVEDVVNDEDQAWPATPRPLAGPPDATDEGVADELCLVAVGFLLHHEFAHRRLRHSGGSAIELEQDADQEATRWLLDAVETLSNKEQKRSLGIGVAMASLVAIGIHTGRHGGTTHPHGFNRLFNTMDRYLGNVPEHSAWLLVSIALKLHLMNNERGLTCPEGEFETPRDAVDAYVESIAAAVAVSAHEEP